MEQGMFQLVVLAYSRQLIEGLGADDCPAASWIFLSEQGDEMASDEQPTIQEMHVHLGYISLTSSRVRLVPKKLGGQL